MRKAEINKALIEMIRPILEPLGFKKKNGSDGWVYFKETDFGFNQVPVLIWQYDEFFFVGLSFMVRISKLNEVFLPYSSFVAKENDNSITIGANIETFGFKGDHKIKVVTEEELQKAIYLLKDILVNQGLFFFEKFTTVDSIDKELNRDNRIQHLFIHDTDRCIVGITAAALNHNPQFSYWESYYREKLSKASEYRKEKYESLVKYLHESVIK